MGDTPRPLPEGKSLWTPFLFPFALSLSKGKVATSPRLQRRKKFFHLCLIHRHSMESMIQATHCSSPRRGDVNFHCAPFIFMTVFLCVILSVAKNLGGKERFSVEFIHFIQDKPQNDILVPLLMLLRRTTMPPGTSLEPRYDRQAWGW